MTADMDKVHRIGDSGNGTVGRGHMTEDMTGRDLTWAMTCDQAGEGPCSAGRKIYKDDILLGRRTAAFGRHFSLRDKL